MFQRFLAPVLLLSLVALPERAPAAEGKISGTIFGDYYAIVANHRDSLKNQNGFWLRRIYFTYDQPLAADWDTRFRLEASNKGDYSADAAALSMTVKDAYLRWKHGSHEVLAGISPSPTWDVIENVWNYRSVEKTPLDLQRMGSAREFGVAVKGSFDQARTVRYHAMIGNGNGEKSETDKFKKFLGSLGVYPDDHIIVEGYADFEPRHGHYDRYTLQGFVAYKADKYRAGAMYARQTRQNGTDTQGGNKANVVLNVVSAFAYAAVSPKVNIFGRLDHTFDPNPDATKIAYIPFASNAKSTFAVAGVDFAPVENVHLIPNAEIIAYSVDKGTKPVTDVIARVTFAWQWK